MAYSDFRSSISGKDIPEDIKSRLLNLHEENVQLKEHVRTGNEKLLKAKAVRSLPAAYETDTDAMGHSS
jgi:protein HOOK3